MRWIEFPDPRLAVFGLPWFAENSPDLFRLPKSRQARYREAVWHLAKSPAGGRIRFVTDANELRIRLDYGDVGHMNNMHRIGQHAVDCYADGVFWRNAAPADERQSELETTLYSGVGTATRAIDLYLPLYHHVRVVAVGLSDGALISPAPPFAHPLPVVFYGSSITQGGCASHSGNSYQSILCRALNLDQVNLGFSGNGLGEPELAEAMADIEASAYVVDYSQNCPTVEQMAETYSPFLRILREARRDAPILCITPISAAPEAWSATTRETLEAKREVVRRAVIMRHQAGDQRVQVIEGPALLGPDQMDGIVDSSHPNDLGFWYMANGLKRPLAGVLGL